MIQTEHEQRNTNLAQRADTLRQYVSDMLALEKHTREAVERQRTDAGVKQQAQAYPLINRIGMTLEQHVAALEQQLVELQGSSSSVKAAVTSALGVAAGLYAKVRTQEVSHMLRDDYTALSLAALSYTMLHTTGLALYDSTTANLALRHLQDLTPLLREITRIIPQVVADELIPTHPHLNLVSVPEALRQTQAAWNV